MTAWSRLLAAGASGVNAWTHAGPFSCATATRGFTYVTCRRVPASAFGRNDLDPAHEREVIFTFDKANVLVGVDVLARTTPGRAAAAVASGVERQLSESLGTPHRSEGRFDAAALSTPYLTVSRQYRYASAVVQLTATAVPGSGAVIREQYLRVSPETQEF